MYNYECAGCGDVFEKNVRIAERDEPCETPCEKCSGKLSRTVAAPLVGYSTLTANSTYGKIPQGFKDVLNKIHTKSPGSNIKKSSSFNLD